MVVILGFAASVVVLNAPPIKPPAKDEAQRFAARLKRAADQAVISGIAYRLEVREGGYTIARRAGEDWSPEIAATMPVRPETVVFKLQVGDLAADNALALNGGRSEPPNQEEKDLIIVPLEPFGLTAEFSAAFESRRGAWDVVAAADGTITVTQR